MPTTGANVSMKDSRPSADAFIRSLMAHELWLTRLALLHAKARVGLIQSLKTVLPPFSMRGRRNPAAAPARGPFATYLSRLPACDFQLFPK